jgi:hypothetical protein
LKTWLETATQNLVPAAKTRVCEEITEHYTAALEQHQPKPNAEALALADLGNVEEARQRFEQALLTIQELGNQDQELERTKKLSSLSPLVFIAVGYSLLALSGRLGYRFDPLYNFLAIVHFLMAIGLALQIGAAKNRGLSGFARSNFYLHLVFIPLGLGLLLLHEISQLRFYSTNNLFIVGALVWTALQIPKHHTIWRKVQKTF